MMDMSEDLVNVHFDENRKRQGLTVVTTEEASSSQLEDKSRKGSVDHRILTLVNFINSTECFFTTSSCSGRSILFTHEEENSKTGEDVDVGDDNDKANKGLKKGCTWIYVTHDEISEEEFLQKWLSSIHLYSEVVFKVEPSILHIQCRYLSTAKKLVHCATESGFRNSGMVIGKDNKITVAVRSAMSMEVPLPTCSATGEVSKRVINDEFLKYLIAKGNEKLQENWKRTDKFTNEFLRIFSMSLGNT